MSDSHLAPGVVVAGKYRIERVLGEGGMGYVLGARNLALDEPVAIKVLKHDAVSSAEAVARFFREARAAVRMKGEHVAKVLDVGQLDDGTPYMLMELLEGSDLQALVDNGGPLPLPTAVDYVLQTCEALAEAHANGIVHRDVKPSNLFLVRGPTGAVEIRLLDFGLATSVAVDTAALDGALAVGTPAYMSPEQIRAARNIDGRTDVWSLGATLHELLVGRPPHEGRGALTVFSAILQGRRASVGTLRSDVPRSLEAIVEQCLAIDRAARFASVDALARALRYTLAELREGVRELPLRALRPRRAAGA
jgi:serine/threonine-protein kinase